MAKRTTPTAKKAKSPAKKAKPAAARPAKPSAGTAVVYPLKIALEDVSPPVWRRVQVKDCTLADLHDIIQTAMGWDDAHLHLFEIGREQFAAPSRWGEGWGDEEDMGDARKVKISQLVARGVKKFRYVYDMGDDWRHIIQIEKPVAAETGARYPRCIEGARACPPEDCGGPWGYNELLDAMQDKKHPQHRELTEWLGDPFDAEEFNLKAVNAELGRIR